MSSYSFDKQCLNIIWGMSRSRQKKGRRIVVDLNQNTTKPPVVYTEIQYCKSRRMVYNPS